MKNFKAICILISLTGSIIFLVHPFIIDYKNEVDVQLTAYQYSLVNVQKFQLQVPKIPQNRKVTIATVACSAKKNETYIYEEALVMMKSVLISAKLNNVEELEFHIYLEDLQKKKYYVESFKNFGFSPNKSMVTLYFHSAINAVPKIYHGHMIYHPRFRCSYVRAFFPRILPRVDSILYLDSDVIITEDIYKLWSHLFDMKESQLIAVGYNNEEIDKNYGDLDQRLFGDIPHVKPNGINNGVVLMNLTKMREYEWEEKLLNLYTTYSQVIKWMTVQRLMNILLYYDPDLLYVIRCEFHIIHTHCTKGLTCPYVLDDKVDIHLVHGANTFENNGIFEPIYSAYEKFNMKTGDVLHDLYYPIRNIYQSRIKLGDPCNLVLAENLYKKYVTHLNLFNESSNNE